MKSDNKFGLKLIAMIVMVTCKNCGHKYKSEVLQTPDEDTLRSEPHEDIIENCPKCNQITSYSGADFRWE
jgi:transcription elongation factor Elf1